jgi:tRNA(Arg) A34 adenosine deaminase TadA
MCYPESVHPLIASRRNFLRKASLAAAASLVTEPRFASAAPPAATPAPPADSALDSKRMRDLASWTALTMDSPHPVPFGAEIFHTKTGESLMRAANSMSADNDPSAHGEVHAIRLACAKLGSSSLAGYTLYTTCEPCPMCMSCSLWAGLDRIVYGAKLTDAARYSNRNILITAAEVVKRSDIACIVDGPIERDICLTLFTNPKMQKTFKEWNSLKP